MKNTRAVLLGIGFFSIMTGLVLISSGAQMCRTSCWIDGIFKLLLPGHLETWAGGLSWLTGGIAITLFGLLGSSNK